MNARLTPPDCATPGHPGLAPSDAQLRGMRRGVEKESLRVTPQGHLAATAHPQGLGSALTHPHITTDFSEAQIELVTGAHRTVDDCLAELAELHAVAQHTIAAGHDERLWVYSMPCALPEEDAIPIARFGPSNIGQAKEVYRKGLTLRYGRRMQTISGIHYNWSLPGLSTDDYFALIRNVRRHVPKLLLLFGASPAVCPCFVMGLDHALAPLDAAHPCGAWGLPHATSLRMGRLGYQSDAQASVATSYNCLETYAATLTRALTLPYPRYAEAGLYAPDGSFQQMSTSLLQIENEFYSAIRPKCITRPGERPLHALRERGVEYVELRCMDLNPFVPEGIDAATMRVLDLFMLRCLADPSPPDSPQEFTEVRQRQLLAAERGREPSLPLLAESLVWMAELSPLAERLDSLYGGAHYQMALAGALATLTAPDQLPSARVVAGVLATPGADLGAWVAAQSAAVANEQRARRLPTERLAHWQELAEESLRAQAAVDAAERLPFEQYLREYLAGERLELQPGEGSANRPSAQLIN